MAIWKRITFKKSVMCLGIMILCLLAGIDDILGFWQPMNFGVAVIQSASSQDDDGGHHSIKAVYCQASWKCTTNIARQLSFSQAYREEIKWQVSLICLGSFHDRAPPSFS
jgi:hypothetical protein